jgi:putative FmdB family regulatory protein
MRRAGAAQPPSTIKESGLRSKMANRRGYPVPLYEYRCTACGHVFEKIQSFSAPDEKECPKCAGAVERLISAPAIQFKGSGFYLTDYGKSGGSSSKSEGKSDGGSSKSSGSSEGGSSGSGSASSSGTSDSSASSATPKTNTGSSGSPGSSSGGSSSGSTTGNKAG